jgi:hypothetical protein
MGNWRSLLCAACVSSGVLSLLPALNAGAKQETSPAWVLHKQKVEAEKLDLRPAERPCANWAWVAVITDMAAARGVHIDQQYLVDRLYGGSRCTDLPGNSEDLAKQISHDYVLPSGQKFALDAKFILGAPTQPDSLIASIRQNRPLLLMWENRAYLLIGLTYDEYIAESGNKLFVITEMQLFDPLREEGKRKVIFSRDQNNPTDINGVLDLTVYTK